MFAEYSSDETFALIVCAVAGLVSWLIWFSQLFVVERVRKNPLRKFLLSIPLVCALVLLVVLSHWSSEDVRTDLTYIVFYMIMGAAWVGLFRGLLSVFGISWRDDILERGNSSASFAVAGGLVGITCCFAGGNVGNGPGWWVVIFSGLLSTGSFFLLWLLMDAFTSLSEKITVERDVAAGLRAAALFLSWGLILGRSAAGDWVSGLDTAKDFVRMAWPALALTPLAIVIERSSSICLPSASPRALPAAGWVPALVYAATGIFVLLLT